MSEDPFGDAVLKAAFDLAVEAAELVLEMRQSVGQRIKSDGTIVTDADVAAAALIRSGLAARFPGQAILTEEDSIESDRLSNHICWIVDPIDGTAAYASGSDDFDVFIARSVNGGIEKAVAVNPPSGFDLLASAGGGAWIGGPLGAERLTFAVTSDRPVIATRPFLGAPANLEMLRSVATAIGADLVVPEIGINPRSFVSNWDAIVGLYPDGMDPGTHEWDMAPMDLIVREAGGWSTDLAGNPLRFNQADTRMWSGMVFAKSADLGRAIVQALERLANNVL